MGTKLPEEVGCDEYVAAMRGGCRWRCGYWWRWFLAASLRRSGEGWCRLQHGSEGKGGAGGRIWVGKVDVSPKELAARFLFRWRPQSHPHG